jgi:hypothetical protein
MRHEHTPLNSTETTQAYFKAPPNSTLLGRLGTSTRASISTAGRIKTSTWASQLRRPSNFFSFFKNKTTKENDKSLFVWLNSHEPEVLFSQNKPATSNQSTLFFSQNKSALATNHLSNEHAEKRKKGKKEKENALTKATKVIAPHRRSHHRSPYYHRSPY